MSRRLDVALVRPEGTHPEAVYVSVGDDYVPVGAGATFVEAKAALVTELRSLLAEAEALDAPEPREDWR